MKAKRKMAVTLYPQHKTATPTTKTMKVVRKTSKTMVYMIAKTPFSTMTKTTRKKLHRGTKANRRRQIRRRILTKKINMTTEPVLRKSTVTAPATEPVTAEVIGILAPEEDIQNGQCSLARARKRKRWEIWQSPKHPRRQL